MEWGVMRQNGFYARFKPFPSRHEDKLAISPSQLQTGKTLQVISSPRLVQFPYPSPASTIDPSPLRKEVMSQPWSLSSGSSSTVSMAGDPFFFTPRQLAERLLFTYPPDYKVSPTRLKHSIILGNDVSGKVFLSAIPKLNDLESMLGVETLGARIWLWDEITRMRKTSKGYSDWKNKRQFEGDNNLKPGSAKRRRISTGELEASAKRQALSSRWAAVRTTPLSLDSSNDRATTGSSISSPETLGFGRRIGEEEEEEEEEALSSVSRSRSTTIATSSATTTSVPTEMSERETTTDWDSDFLQEEPLRPSSFLLKGKGSRSKKFATRALRPRSHNLRDLIKSELVDILDPEVLDISEITIMLYAIREIPEDDLYEEFIRAAKVTAKEVGLPPSMLALKEDKETVKFVHEMAAVYSSWVLSKPYPLESLNRQDVERIADFDLFLQFKVQFLNLLLPYDKRRRSSSYHAANSLYPGRTPTPTPRAIPKTSSKSWASRSHPSRLGRSEPNLVTSDLPSSASKENVDRCPETGWSSRQREWGETVVKKYRDTNKSWSRKPQQRLHLTKSHGKDEPRVRPGSGIDILEDQPESRAVPWGVDYVQGYLTPEGLQAFVDWCSSSSQGRSRLLRWKHSEPKAYAEFVEKFLNMESQLAVGIQRLEELHKVRDSIGRRRN